MTTSKEIKMRIQGIKSTKKITHAMELISASKMNKSIENMINNNFYNEYLRNIITRITDIQLDIKKIFFKNKLITKNVAIIIISTNKGLCGALNNNLFKLIQKKIKNLKRKEIKISVVSIGKKCNTLIKKNKIEKIASCEEINETPKIKIIKKIIKPLMKDYNKKKIDQILICGNKFISTMSYKPYCEELIPIIIKKNKESKKWNYIYETEDKYLLKTIIKKYIISEIYKSIVDNITCENSARMIAMKNSTDNSKKIIKELQYKYNKNRQEMITKEISEIVSGSEAIKN